MPINNIPFQSFEPGGFPHPLLRIRIINSHAKKGERRSIRALGLIDTGAMSCAVPAYLAKSISHNFKKGYKQTFIGAGGEGDAYAHSTKIEIIVPGQEKII